MNDSVITNEMSRSWRNRLEVIDNQIARLMREREALAELISGAEKYQKLIERDASTREELIEPSQERRTVSETVSEASATHRKPTFPEEVSKILSEKGGPLTYEDLRNELFRGPLAEALSESDKGFYHAIRRLEKRGKLVKHYGYLFSPKGFEEYNKKERDGLVPSLEKNPQSSRYSPMGEEVILFVNANPEGVLSKDIVSHLKKDERFSEVVEKNATNVYNVIARLVKRNQIIKVDRRIFPQSKAEGDSQKPA